GLDLSAMQRQVARPIATDALGGVETRRKILPEVAQHHFDPPAAAAEEDGLHAGADPRRSDTTRFQHRAAPHSHLTAEHRRVVEDEPSFAAWRAIAFDQLDVLLLQQFLRELEWVGDRCGCADEGWRRSVKGTDAFQPADDVCDLAAKE